MEKTFLYASDAYLKIPDVALQALDERNSYTHFSADAPYVTVLAKARQIYTSGQDLAVRPVVFKPRAVFFDMDSTLIGQESLVEMARFLGKGEEVDRLTEKAMAGKMDFETSLRERLKVLQGVSTQLLRDVLSRLTLNPGVEGFIESCQARSIKCFLISGGFMELAQPFAERLKLTDFHAHRLEQNRGILTGQLLGGVVDAVAKAAWLQKMAYDHELTLAETLVVGDGANDKLMMRDAGYAVGYRAKPVLFPILHAHLGNGHYDFLKTIVFS